MDNKRTYYIQIKTAKKNIGIISSFLDGLEYIGFSRTIDENKGLVEIISPLSQKDEIEEFLIDLNNWIKYKVVSKIIGS